MDVEDNKKDAYGSARRRVRIALASTISTPHINGSMPSHVRVVARTLRWVGRGARQRPVRLPSARALCCSVFCEGSVILGRSKYFKYLYRQLVSGCTVWPAKPLALPFDIFANDHRLGSSGCCSLLAKRAATSVGCPAVSPGVAI